MDLDLILNIFLITTDEQFPYVTNKGDSSISIIRLSDNSLVTNISDDISNPKGIAITPDGQYAYVTNWLNAPNGFISVIRLSDNTLVTTLQDGFDLTPPYGIAITSSFLRAFERK
jgi:DNA-binding beta-propeller fold protein YncE